ncbi:hypothetical protein RSAG8_13515, partial [Rhizoctonia solani AG-8 WAC10335]
MAIQPTGLIIEIPPEATAQQQGPFFGIHNGVVNGVYNSDGWSFIHNLVKSGVARKFVDPIYGRFTLWNAAVWFRETGIKLDDVAAAQLEELPRPPRQILSGEVFSALYPPGTTIIHHDRDIILPYIGRVSRNNHVLLMPRADFDGNEDDDTLNDGTSDFEAELDQLEPQLGLDNDNPGPGVASAAPSQSEPTTVGLLDAFSHALPPSAVSMPEVQGDATHLIGHPPTWVSRSGDDTWVYHRSTYIASPTISMSSPERSPERPTTDNQPSGSQPQYLGSQATHLIGHVPPPPPTIANTNSRPPSPQPPTWVSCSSDDTWVYHRSTYIASPTISMSLPERSPEHPTTDNQPSGSQPQYLGSQASTSSSLPLPSSQDSSSQLHSVNREARHRMRTLSNMRHKDPIIESQICTEVILHLLASGDFTSEGLTEIMNAAADSVAST